MSRQYLPLTFVLACLAGFLALTAGLKLQLLTTNPFADILSESSFPLLWFALLAEVVVIAVISSRLTIEFKWVIVTMFWAILTAVSLLNVLGGKSACGCAGSFAIQPFWFLAFNGMAFSILFLCRPETISTERLLSNIQLSRRQLGSFAAILSVGIAFCFSQCRWVQNIAKAYYLSHSVFSTPVDLGKVPPLAQVCELRLQNFSDEKRKILGYQRSCNCVVLDDIKSMTIPPRGELVVQLRIRPTNSGRFHQRLLLFIDSPKQHFAAADIHGFFKEN